MGARLGIVFYWLGAAATVAFLSFNVFALFVGVPLGQFLLAVVGAFIPFLMWIMYLPNT